MQNLLFLDERDRRRYYVVLCSTLNDSLFVFRYVYHPVPEIAGKCSTTYIVEGTDQYCKEENKTF